MTTPLYRALKRRLSRPDVPRSTARARLQALRAAEEDELRGRAWGAGMPSHTVVRLPSRTVLRRSIVAEQPVVAYDNVGGKRVVVEVPRPEYVDYYDVIESRPWEDSLGGESIPLEGVTDQGGGSNGGP